MELRKTLCHPYLVREELEHDTGNFQTMHKNLVEASSKLTFLGKTCACRVRLFLTKLLQ